MCSVVSAKKYIITAEMKMMRFFHPLRMFKEFLVVVKDRLVFQFQRSLFSLTFPHFYLFEVSRFLLFTRGREIEFGFMKKLRILPRMLGNLLLLSGHFLCSGASSMSGVCQLGLGLRSYLTASDWQLLCS